MRTELAYRMLVTLLFVSEQWGVLTAKNYTQPYKVDFVLAFPVTCYIVITKVINATEQDDASFGDICVNTYTKSYFYARNGRQKVLPGIYVALGY